MPPAADHSASRQNSDSNTFNTLVPAYEDRLIIVAQGIQFHTDQIRKDMGGLLDKHPNSGYQLSDFLIPDYLQLKLGDKVHIASDQTITYTSDVQRVNFTLKFITSRDDYLAALQTPGVHVMYNGHARYGRGPCFGDDPSPGDQWANKGLWRIGFPFLAVDVAEILENGYFADPVTGAEPMPPRADCHPEVRAKYSSYKKYKVGDLALTPADRIRLIGFLNTTGDADQSYWASGTPSRGPAHMDLLMHADWQQTRCTPYDLGATDLQCRVYCHFGCSTFLHNYPILRKLRKWTREGNERYAYWTTNVSDSLLDGRWLHRLLTYPKDNAFQSWEGSLQYAVQKASRDIRNKGGHYDLI